MRDPGKKRINTPEEVILKRRRRLRDEALLTSAIQKILVVTVALVIIFGFIFGITPMKGGDMEPKLSAGDLLIYYRMEKEPVRGDILLMERDGKQYVGRLVGMPNDMIVITGDGTINVNGSAMIETDVYFETRPYADGVKYPIVLEEGEYFLLAAKRDTAKDSRYFGPVKAEEIKGKVLTSISTKL